MKGKKRLIKEAYSAYRKKRYAEAAAFLENLIRSGESDSYVKTLLAAVSLRSGRIDRAAELIGQAVKEGSDYLPADRMSAFLYLKSAPDKESVVSAYASAISRHPEDRQLKTAMKKIVSAPDFTAFQKSALLSDFAEPPAPSFVKKPGRRFLRRGAAVTSGRAVNLKYLFIFAVLLFAASVFSGSFYYFYKQFHSSSGRIDFTPVEHAVISGSEHDIDRGVPRKALPEFYPDAAGLSRDYNKARDLIKKGGANDALVILNRIMNSNASFSVKERADFLINFIGSMDERKFETYDFDEFSEKPYLYRGVAVSCGGRVANLRRRQNGYTFTLLLDYRDSDRFSGTAEVFYQTESVDFKNGSLVDMRGFFYYASSSKQWYMVAAWVDEM